MASETAGAFVAQALQHVNAVMAVIAAGLTAELVRHVADHDESPLLHVAVECGGRETITIRVFDSEPDHLPGHPVVPSTEFPLVQSIASQWGMEVDRFGKSRWFSLPRDAFCRLPSAEDELSRARAI